MRKASVGGAALLLVRVALRAIWFVLLPAALTGIALRYLTPYATLAPGLEGELARLARAHTLVLGLGIFLTLAWLIHYVRGFIPGGSYLAALPLALAGRVPRRRTASCERASALLSWMNGAAGVRWLAELAPEQRTARITERDQLSALLEDGKWSRVERASAPLLQATHEARRRGEAKTNAVFVLALAVTAVVALQLRARYLQTYEVLGSSMLPSLAPGELLLGRVAAYDDAHLPRRGELVVLRATVDGGERELIKRVIGLPGDHIGMRGGVPVINGWIAPICDAGPYFSPEDASARGADAGGRVYVEFIAGQAYFTFQTTFAQPFQEYVVKPGELFVLGDNRSNSRDSRNFEQGAARGFPLGAVKATVSRSLFARTRRGELEPTSLWQPLGRTLSIEGVDTSETVAGTQRCFALRPEHTDPPPAPRTALASSAR